MSYSGTTSQTPEEYVARLLASGEPLYVARRACRECWYLPEGPVTRAELSASFTRAELPTSEHFFECQHCAVANLQGNTSVPDFFGCYAFFYQHWHENRYLRAAQEAGLIAFVETEGLPSLSETHYRVLRPLLWMDESEWKARRGGGGLW